MILEAFKGFFTSSKTEDTTENPTSPLHSTEYEENDYIPFVSYNNRTITSKEIRKKKNRKQYDKVQILNQYITKWRKVSIYPEVGEALEDIVNTALYGNELNYRALPPLDFDPTSKLNKTSKQKLIESYEKVMSLLKFQTDGYEIIHRFLVDGRIQAEIVYLDGDKMKEGVYKVNMVSPVNLVKFYDDDDRPLYTYANDYAFRLEDIKRLYANNHIYKDEQMVQVESSIFDPYLKIYVSSIHKALKAANNMSQVEDSMVLVRFMKGIMLRIWNVNVGRMPATKAKQFLREVDKTINNDIKYDPDTGEFKTKKGMMELFQDMIFPSRSNNDITQVQTVEGDTNLLEGPDHELFMKKLYKALHIPVSRLSDTPTIEFDSLDILKDEETFLRYVNRVRLKIQQFIFEIMKRDLLAQGIITEEDWDLISNQMFIKWDNSSNIVLRVRMELWQKRADTLADLKDSGLIGNVLSYDYVFKNVLGLSEQEIEQQKELIAKEKQESPELYEEE